MKKSDQEKIEEYKAELRGLYSQYNSINVDWRDEYNAKFSNDGVEVFSGIIVAIICGTIAHLLASVGFYVGSFLIGVGVIYGVIIAIYGAVSFLHKEYIIDSYRQKMIIKERIIVVQDGLRELGDYLSKYLISGYITEEELEIWEYYKSLRDSEDYLENSKYNSDRYYKAHNNLIERMEKIEKETLRE